MDREKGKLRYLIPLIICFLLVTAVHLPAAERQALQPTLNSMDFYGYIEGAQRGDEVTVYDGQNVLCGRFVADKDGRYGFLHVYGDDKGTAVDEGADRNELLTFRLNGSSLAPVPQQELRWLGDGQKLRVDFISK